MAAGFTGEILVKLIRHSPSVLQMKPRIARLQFWRDFMGDNDAFLKLIQKNGLLVTRGSNMFLHGLLVVGNYKKQTIEKKLEYFQKMYGWSEEEVWVAFNKFPNLLAKSEKTVKATMDFLIKNVGLEPRSIAMRPIFFSYSLEKRLVPRQHVLNILKEHGLNKDPKLFTACVMSQKTFHEKFIMPYKKDIPGLADTYAAACSGKVPH